MILVPPAQPQPPPDVKVQPWLRDGRRVITIDGDLVCRAVDWRTAQVIVRDHVIE